MGKKELVVSGHNGTTRLALIENGQLAELHIETPEHARTIGNVVLGKVKKVMPNIRAAFVDIGMGQDAFLHYSDLTDNLPQMLAFVDQDNPDLRSWGVASGHAAGQAQAQRGQARQVGGQRRQGGCDSITCSPFAGARGMVRPSGRRGAICPNSKAAPKIT